MGKHRKIENGDIFFSLKVIEKIGLRPYSGKNATIYLCKCLKCGKITEVPQFYLGEKKDCGCERRESKKKIEIGSKFNRLEVIGVGKYVKGDGNYYICRCDCQKHTILEVRRDILIRGEVMSCGCVHDELFEKNRQKAYEKNFANGTNIPKIAYDKLQKNNTSGYRGVSWHKGASKWRAQIGFQGKKYSLGYYDDVEQAASAYKAAEKELRKDFWKWYKENFPKEYGRIEKSPKNTIR